MHARMAAAQMVNCRVTRSSGFLRGRYTQASQYIPRVLRNLNVHHGVQKTLYLYVPVLN
jgi:hypothetical protein